jgi:hypothetical protein
MIDPATLTNAVVSALQGIPALVTAMGNDPSKIYAHHYLYGSEHKFQEALYKIVPPSILVVWEGTLGGNFDGMTMWKHRIACYLRTSNVANVQTPASYEHLFYVMVNSSVNKGQNIRYTNILNTVDIMDTPSANHMVDEDGMDYFKVDFVIPELGDN